MTVSRQIAIVSLVALVLSNSNTPVRSNEFELESSLRLKRAPPPADQCVEVGAQIDEIKVDGRNQEVIVLDGPCFDECRRKHAPSGVGGSLWQRIKGFFNGDSSTAAKKKAEADCFLKCFC